MWCVAQLVLDKAFQKLVPAPILLGVSLFFASQFLNTSDTILLNDFFAFDYDTSNVGDWLVWILSVFLTPVLFNSIRGSVLASAVLEL